MSSRVLITNSKTASIHIIGSLAHIIPGKFASVLMCIVAIQNEHSKIEKDRREREEKKCVYIYSSGVDASAGPSAAQGIIESRRTFGRL